MIDLKDIDIFLMIENLKHFPSVRCLCKAVTLISVNYTIEVNHVTIKEMLPGFTNT